MLAFSNGRYLPFAEGGLAWNDAIDTVLRRIQTDRDK